MKKLSLAALITTALLSQSALAESNNHMMSYLTSWGLPADAATQMMNADVDTYLLSFGGWDQDGAIYTSDNIAGDIAYNDYWLPQTYTSWTQVKLAAPYKKMMVAFGGATYESIWAHLANDNSRENIAQGLVKLLRKDFPVYQKGLQADQVQGPCLSTNGNGTCNLANYQKAGTVQIDGIDFDFEKTARLTPEENNNLIKLVKRVRELLGPNSGKLISLTTYHVGADPLECSSSSVTEGCSFIEDARSTHHGEVLDLLKNSRDLFDFYNVMAYDAGPRFKYDVAMANYAKAVGDAKKIILGNTLTTQWGPEGRYAETRENNIARAAWQAANGYGGVFVWAMGANDTGLSFGDQIDYINDMKNAASGGVPETGNTVPVARASYQKEVQGSATVTLDASSSYDADGDTLTYTWTQVAGPQVTLNNANQQKATFTLNSTDVDTTLGFKLTVNDGKDDSLPLEFSIKHLADDVAEEPEEPGEEPGDEPGEEPGENPGDNPGEEPGDNPGNGDVTAWNASTIYAQPCQKVTYQGKVWVNGWYVQGEAPSDANPWGAWRPVGSATMHTQCK
ncbi:glycosyl hydrolase family 18 protein [Kosakonia oryzae]|uniref:Chitinase n=1 Tax=Kosakonia oryzae TaxID=497725 RepID=A0AA94H0N2_9ENTR|nr:glycosyl hydrolase family 18 protein [Kosakonia oryzae]ANI84224.1 hypothetical protein AWR26_19470 [Kosakonia oryzae]SFB69097.1 chitinase [Kosakonia oryzae]